MFSWGEYDVVVLAIDAAYNTAVCTFRVIVTAFACPDLRIDSPQHGAWRSRTPLRPCILF